MYNLLAKLRSGEAFTDKERAQHEAAQTEILRQLHDELDAAVAKSYGWPVDLPDADILVNLVALNKDRVAEEKRGVVRWLRPEYQNPAPVLTPLPGALPQVAAVRVPLPVLGADETEIQIAPGPIVLEPRLWPKDLKTQLAALREVMLSTGKLWSMEAVAQAFKSRGRYRESIAAHLDLLTDLGMLSRVETSEGPRWHRPQAMGA
jgi:hypothetical protein